MTADLFTRLAGRTLGKALVVQPDISPIFANLPSAEGDEAVERLSGDPVKPQSAEIGSARPSAIGDGISDMAGGAEQAETAVGRENHHKPAELPGTAQGTDATGALLRSRSAGDSDPSMPDFSTVEAAPGGTPSAGDTVHGGDVPGERRNGHMPAHQEEDESRRRHSNLENTVETFENHPPAASIGDSINTARPPDKAAINNDDRSDIARNARDNETAASRNADYAKILKPGLEPIPGVEPRDEMARMIDAGPTIHPDTTIKSKADGTDISNTSNGTASFETPANGMDRMTDAGPTIHRDKTMKNEADHTDISNTSNGTAGLETPVNQSRKGVASLEGGPGFAIYSAGTREKETISPLEDRGVSNVPRPARVHKINEPIVRVTIGRVYVKAVRRDGQAEKGIKVARRTPALSLDEYLKRRSGDGQ